MAQQLLKKQKIKNFFEYVDKKRVKGFIANQSEQLTLFCRSIGLNLDEIIISPYKEEQLTPKIIVMRLTILFYLFPLSKLFA